MSTRYPSQLAQEKRTQSRENTIEQIHNGISIIQFNCGQTNYATSRPIFDALEPANRALLAIQEPAFSKLTNSTYCPRGFKLVYEANPATRVCFMVSEELGTGQWRHQSYGPHVIKMELQTKETPLSVINVYNPQDNGPRIRTWTQIEKALNEADGEIILLGDFNAHHPAWGGEHVESEQQADHLLRETQRRGLHLVTPKGEATWKRGKSESVIDLTFMTEGVRQRVTRCKPRDGWAITQDHLPIDIQLSVHSMPKPPSKRYAVKKLDKAALIKQITETHWELHQDPLSRLQEVVKDGLEKHCPRARPHEKANHKWTPRAKELLVGARRARKAYLHSPSLHHRQSMKSHQNLLKKELRRGSRAAWRRFVWEITTSKQLPHNKGLWRISRWSRQTPETRTAQVSALRRNEQEGATLDDEKRAQILAERFFPGEGLADLSDIDGSQRTTSSIHIPTLVTPDEIKETIRKLPNGKAPGPDSIPNEVLKLIAPTVAENLAQAVTELLQTGNIPSSYKESVTAVIRKERKGDYTLPSSYRPIALENTLAKVIEKIVATRLAEAAEEHGLLPWNQMGGRKSRSTLSAIDLLTSCVQTAWSSKKGCIVSMLSLDISGAYDHVSTERLLWILQQKGLPGWIIRYVRNFMRERRTRVAFDGYESDWVQANTGIPQGSPISPILFLFFISELLEDLQDVEGKRLGFGFVDDTNIITWGDSAQSNCRRLEEAHKKCMAWARRHGAKFAPDKYKLIHFTRHKRDPSGDLTSAVKIEGFTDEIKPEAKLRVLGVWVDPKLNWKEHTKKAAGKGMAAFEALSRIAASTWGPCTKKTRLLYAAVVRPTMVYGIQSWYTGQDGKQAKSNLQELERIQYKCLRRITGGYKQTPRAALERETKIQPLDIYSDALAMNRALKNKGRRVKEEIRRTVDAIWEAENPPQQTTQRGRGRPRKARQRPPTSSERILQRAIERELEIQGYKAWQAERAGHKRRQRARRRRAGAKTPSQQREGRSAIDEWADLEWRRRWTQAARNKKAATWKTPWKESAAALYSDLPKHQATALFLLRTEVIGLNAWLASMNVPGVDARCSCGWSTQTVKHVLMMCPLYSSRRADLVSRVDSEEMWRMLSTPEKAQATARWFVQQGILRQFDLAREIEEEVTDEHTPFQPLEEAG